EADAYYTLGVTLWQQGNFDESTEELQQAIRARPGYAEAYYTLGSVLKQQGKLPDAAAALREAIKIDPDFAGAHTNLAAVLRQMNDLEGAAAESRTAAELMKRQTNRQAATLAMGSAERLLNAGDFEGAISQFRVAVAASPDNPRAHFGLGLALKRSGDLASAAQEFAAARKLDPAFSPPE
ncbi:MAG TPA: tetratricopeptide repeat protein, partial [Candidatus Acidoferrum sp.]|nr:tetratricopeptide repeat protein [Candidatus Acidoferrum sp.]